MSNAEQGIGRSQLTGQAGKAHAGLKRQTLGELLDEEIEARGGMTPALAEGLSATFGASPQFFLNFALAGELEKLAAPHAEQAGKAQGWRNPRKEGRPDEGVTVQFWVNGNDCASVGFRKGQTWSDLLDMYHSGPQQYDECYVVGWAPPLPAPPTKDPTNG